MDQALTSLAAASETFVGTHFAHIHVAGIPAGIWRWI